MAFADAVPLGQRTPGPSPSTPSARRPGVVVLKELKPASLGFRRVRAQKAIAREAPVGEVVAMPIRSSLNQGVFFEPEVIALMGEALEAACKKLDETDRPIETREIIARRIISAARFGERDPVRLRTAALAGSSARGLGPPHTSPPTLGLAASSALPR
jgi:hypothetical protein